uniref:FAR1 domain-containing protein n=1 Tax=Oryza glaberrima TaxID=4538 RepID=I1Q6T4_ORYGL
MPNNSMIPPSEASQLHDAGASPMFLDNTSAATTSFTNLVEPDDSSAGLGMKQIETDQGANEDSQTRKGSEKMTPKVGMKFNSEQEAYDFYNAYASEIGFSIRRSSYHYMGNTKIIKNRTFCCSREGTRGVDKRTEALGYGNSFNRPETRCKCQACMKISLIDGFYQVYHFVPEHSHILTTKSQAHQLRSQRKVNEAQVASVEVAKSVGISTKAAVDLLAKQSCGYENLGFTRVDMKNKLYSKRSLQTKQEEEEEFIKAWHQLLDKYELQQNKWLQQIFDKRHQWALVYGRNTFSADMSTTQRNESFNNELKGYISVKYDMLTFFEHFDRLLGDKRYEEVKCDFRATQSTPRPKAELRILRDVVEVYTPAVYKIFEEEVMLTLNCDIFYCGDVDEQKVYKIKSHEDIEKWLKIRCNPDLETSSSPQGVKEN